MWPVILPLLIISVQNVNGCNVDLQDCLSNMLEAYTKYGTCLNENINILTNLHNQTLITITNLINEFKSEIHSGPENCRHLNLQESTGYYVFASVEMCVKENMEKYPVINNEMYELFVNLEEKSKDVANRKEYCETIIDYFGEVQRYDEKYISYYQNCNFEKNFRELYITPWLNCVDKI